jgi:hypothetical protein
MDHELLRQLHDAGFPLKPYPEWAAAKDGPMAPEYISPTLEELIEACGEDLSALNQISKKEWFVSSISQGNGDVFSTPVEAVARLWLALHADGNASA